MPALLVIAAGVGGGWWWVQHGARTTRGAQHPAGGPDLAEGQATPEGLAEAEGDVTRVEVVHPMEGGRPRTTTQPGSVHAFQYADLYAKVSGYLKEQSVDFGSPVKKGQLLAVIDDPEVVEDARRAEADVHLASKQVEQMRALIKSTEAERDAARAAVAKAQADIGRYTASRVFAEKRYHRMQGLYAKSAVQQELVDEEQDRYESALAAEGSAYAAVTSAKAQLAAAESKIVKAQADLGETEAKVEVEKANLARAQVFVKYTEIRSPYDGVVTNRAFHPGAFIRSESSEQGQALLTVARIDKIRVTLQVPDVDVPFTDVGDPAEVLIDNLGGRRFEGKVSLTAEAEDPQTRTMHTEIFLDNPHSVLRDGMYGRVTITLAPASKNLTVPSSCLVVGAADSKKNEAGVWVVRDDKAHYQTVRVGYDNGLDVDVLEGLTPADRVILPHNVSLREGQPVIAELIEEKTKEVAKGAKSSH